MVWYKKDYILRWVEIVLLIAGGIGGYIFYQHGQTALAKSEIILNEIDARLKEEINRSQYSLNISDLISDMQPALEINCDKGSTIANSIETNCTFKNNGKHRVLVSAPNATIDIPIAELNYEQFLNTECDFVKKDSSKCWVNTDTEIELPAGGQRELKIYVFAVGKPFDIYETRVNLSWTFSLKTEAIDAFTNALRGMMEESIINKLTKGQRLYEITSLSN
jgi:hypothetical protein